MKHCKKCGEELAPNAKHCTKCGAKQGGFPVWAIVLIVVLGILIIGAIGSSAGDKDKDSSDNNKTSEKGSSSNEKKDNKKEEKKNTKPTLGSTVEFDDLEITIGKEYSFTTVKNQYSEHNKKTVVKVPVHVKNLKDETHKLNMFYISYYGSKGTELEGVSAYFSDDGSIEWAGDLRSGAEYDKFFYFLYDGDGTYAIEFKAFSKPVTIEFEVKK